MDSFKCETAINAIIWILAVGYSISRVVRIRKDFENYEDLYGDFKQGWLIKSTKKDVADYEWETTLLLLQQVYLWLIIHIIISECLRQTYFKVLPYWHFVLSLLCVAYNATLMGAIILIIQPVLFECISKLTKTVFFVWCCSGISLMFIWYLKSLSIVDKLLGLNDVQHYMVVVASCWINLRCISYYIDNKVVTNDSFINALSYSMYLPTLFLGPFMLYSNFEKSQTQYKKHNLKLRLQQFILGIIYFGFWFLFTEFALHYVYVNALSFKPNIVRSLDNWSLYGYGYCMGQFFHLKYVVLYGISSSIARFDHMVPPATPKCIGRIHLYSDMWKYFDEGLYTFLKRYIYFPTLLGKTIKHKMFSSFLCFLFVFIWHGIYQHILIWATLNYVGILLENLFTFTVNIINKNDKLISNPKIKNRLSFIAASPLLGMSAISNFYFFAGTEIGNIFVQRFLKSTLLANFSLLFFLYCCCSISQKLRNQEKHTDFKYMFLKVLKRAKEN